MSENDQKQPQKKGFRWPWDNPDSWVYRSIRTSKRGSAARAKGRLNPPISGKVKQLFYLFSAPLTRLNAVIYRNFRVPRQGALKLHLGPGKTAYLDVWVDLNNALPFPDNTVDAIYSHHVIEHLDDLAFHFDEMFRVLRPGGIFRIGGPNGDTALRKYAEKDLTWFYLFPFPRTSLGGRFDNWLFCGAEHKSILTFSYVEEVAQSAGFTNITLCYPRKDTSYPDVMDARVLDMEFVEPRPNDPYDLLVEGMKPKAPAASAAGPA
jgi:SAM-dependent methyltransferase